MLRSLYSGVSGMKNEQTKLDVIANNVANVSTTAFKSGRVRFQDMLSQTIKNAASPTDQGRGGINPRQVGLGMQVAGIDTMTNQGNSEATGRPYDCAISGDGYFVISDGIKQYYTRDGAFSLDTDFNIVNSDGYKLMGYEPMFFSNKPTDPVNGTELDPSTKTWNDVKLDTKLTADSNITVNGITLKFHQADWKAGDDSEGPDAAGTTYNYYGINTVGKLLSKMNGNKAINATASLNSGKLSITANAGSEKLDVSGGSGLLDVFNSPGPAINRDLNALQSLSIPESNPQDPTGEDKISNFSIEPNGAIKGIYESGSVVLLGEIALSKFANPAGLLKVGGNNYTTSSNSGTANIGGASVDGRGDVLQNTLEMSNVDLANEFTDMIVTSRAFQANSRSITTSDEMLQELLNLKR